MHFYIYYSYNCAHLFSVHQNALCFRSYLVGEDLNKDNEKDAISEYSSDRIPGLRALCLSYPDSEPENAAWELDKLLWWGVSFETEVVIS